MRPITFSLLLATGVFLGSGCQRSIITISISDPSASPSPPAYAIQVQGDDGSVSDITVLGDGMQADNLYTSGQHRLELKGGPAVVNSKDGRTTIRGKFVSLTLVSGKNILDLKGDGRVVVSRMEPQETKATP